MSQPTASNHHETCHHRAYYLTCAEFEEMWAFAAGRCQICATAAEQTPRGKLVIDHLGDYGPAAIRGLLCDRCNAHMRRVDSGERRVDNAVRNYMQVAWFHRRIMFGRGFTVNPKLIRWEWPTDDLHDLADVAAEFGVTLVESNGEKVDE